MNQLPSASGSFTLVVPEAYVRYFVRRIDVLLLLSLAAWLLVLFSHFHGSGRHSISSTVGLISSGPTFILCFWGWQLVRKLPWRHEFDDFTINIVPLHTLRRRRLGRRVDIVTRWEDTRWNGLPALRIFVEGRYFWHRRALLMVYFPDDESVVQTRVIPLLATYQPSNADPVGA